MLPEYHTWPNAIAFTFFRDTSKIAGVPAKLVRFLVPVGFLLLTAKFALAGDWKQAGVTFAIGLVISLALFFIALRLFSYQKKIQAKIFKEFSIGLAADRLSIIQADKINRRIVNKAVKIKWDGRSITEVVFYGEGGKIRDRQAKAFLEYVRHLTPTKDDTTLILTSLENIGEGVLTAITVPINSIEAREYKVHMKIYNILSNVAFINSPAGFPRLEIIDFDPANNPSFSELHVNDFVDIASWDSHERRLSPMLGKTFPPPTGSVWRAEQVESGKIVIKIVKVSQNEKTGKKDSDRLLNMFRFAVKKQGAFVRSIYADVQSIDYHEDSEELETFELYFRDTGELYDDEIYRQIIGRFIKILKKQIPGNWKQKNELMSNNTIRFKRL